MTIELLKPIFAAHLLPHVENLLRDLLHSLEPEEWNLPTIVPGWNVKNIAAHLLDTQLRKLSLARDGYFHSGGPQDGEELAGFINRKNAEGVEMYSRFSPRVLTSLMEIVSRES